MAQDILPLLHSLTQQTEEASATEDHLIQLCDDQQHFHAYICKCLMPYQSEYSDAAYKWLFLWFSSPLSALRNYALQFIPALLSTYLTALYSREQASATVRKRCEICLSALIPYVKEYSNNTSSISLHATTANASLYFYPSTPLDSRQPAKIDLPSDDSPSTPQHTQHKSTLLSLVERINGSTRPLLLPLFLSAFTEDLASHPTPVKLSYCHAVTTMCASGLSEMPWSPYMKHCREKQDPALLSDLTNLAEKPRIHLTQSLLLEMSRGLRFCLEQAVSVASLQASECIYFRSLLDMYPQAQLCSNALLNLLSEQMREEITVFERSEADASSRNQSVSTLVEDISEVTIEFESGDHLHSSLV